jgi:hypothetical protein
VTLLTAHIVRDLFGHAVGPQWLDQMRQRPGLKERGSYSVAVAVAVAVMVRLMMWQRLDGRFTPAMAVRQVAQAVLGEALAQSGWYASGGCRATPER